MSETDTPAKTAYVVIARRYRPQQFSAIVGQDPIVRTLRNSILEDRFPHAWLFAGIRGVGKTTAARVLAKALNCRERKTEEPCNECVSCKDITDGRSLDSIEIDGASNRGIDQIRELRETIRSYPARDPFRILIIDEVHMLTREAFNALLKTLEEPPAHVRFILATTELRKVPDTIASRCQVFEFRRVPPEVIQKDLGRIAALEGITISPRGLSLLARAAAGSLRDAQSQMDQAIAHCGKEIEDDRLASLLGVTDVDRLREFAQGIADKDTAALLLLIGSLIEDGGEPLQFCRDMQAYVRDLILVRNGVEADTGSLLRETDADAARGMAKKFSEDQLIRIFDLLVRDDTAIRYSPYPRYLLEVLAAKLARLTDLVPIEQLIAELRGAGNIGSAEKQDAGNAGEAVPRWSQPGLESSSRAPTPSAAPAAELEQEQEPQPDPQPAPSPANDSVREILNRLHTRKASLWAFLSSAPHLKLEGDSLRIGFSERQGFSRKTVQEKDNLDLLEGICNEILGHPVKVEVVEEAEPTRDLAEISEKNHQEMVKNQLIDTAMKEPVVQSLLDTFEGEIVEAQKAGDREN